jgi:hypothetical protein
MKAIAALAILLATTAIATAQLAQKTPQRHANPPRDLYCRDMQIDEGGSVQTCMAYTMEQCLASRANPSERCYLNPIYDPRFRR